jgi:DNA-binding response OmpR family regulator
VARILIVDDDVIIRDLLLATLDFGEHELVHAPDGEAAVRAFQERPADLVLLDLDLPGIGGLDVLRRLRAGHAPRVIVLTGSGREREPLLRQAGATGYLTKPFSPLELLGEIERVLS